MATKKPKKKVSAKKPKKAKVVAGSLKARRAAIRNRHTSPTVIYEKDERLVIPTRFPLLNQLLGGGVIPGAIIEMFGFEDSGKSSLSTAIAADVQAWWRANGNSTKTHIVIVNYENPEPWKWWGILGIDLEKDADGEGVYFTQLRPQSLEEGMADMIDLVESGQVCAVIIDSVYAATAKGSKNIKEDWQNPKKGGGSGGGIAVEARQWGMAWTAFKTVFMEHQVVVIAVNQMREKIETGGGKKPGFHGKPVTTPRGHALKFYAWVRLKLRGKFMPDKAEGVDGKIINIKVVKNKTSDDGLGQCEYPLVRGVGFDLISDLINLALQAGVIKGGGGGHFQIGKTKIRGKDRLREIILERPKVKAAIEKSVEKWLTRVDED